MLMSVGSITNTTPTPQVAPPISAKSAAAAAAEEARETAATTRQEAAKGDPVAIRKLAREQQSEQARESTSARESGKGALIDRKV
jgi:hypothetical protein